MKKMTKTLSILVMAAFICCSLSACYDKREIDDLAYPVAIGFDLGKNNFLRITLQIAKPGETAGDGAQSSGGGGKPFVITTVEAPTMYSAFNMINTYISRQINVSNTVALVFSKQLAQNGLEYLINAISRGREFRPSMYIVISRTTAEEYINAIEPSLEKSPAKYYQLNYTSYMHTAFTANTQLHYFSNYMDSYERQAVAILAGVNKHESIDAVKPEDSTYLEKGRAYPLEGDFKAGNLPRSGNIKAETMGLAVFDGDKMVGELDGEETSLYLMLTGEYKNAFWTFLDPEAKDKFVLLNIRQNRQPVNKVNINSDNPQIYSKILLEADIISIQSGINYEAPEMMPKLESYIEAYLKNNILRLLNKTSEEFHSDIFGFGSNIKKNFLTFDEFTAYKWKVKYKDSSFSADVTCKIRRPGLIMSSSKAVNSKGEGGPQ